MGILGIFLLVVFVLSAVLLIIIVLMQDEQGEGLGGLFGGGSTTAFGSRSGNVLTKFTAILGAIFITCSFGLAWVNRTYEQGDVLGAARRLQATDTVEEWWITDTEEEGGEAAAPEAEEVQEPSGTLGEE